MSGPEVVVSFDSRGAAAVKRELGATDKQLSKLDKQLAKMQERQLFEQLKARSEAWQTALGNNRKAMDRLTSAMSKVGSAAVKMNQAFDLAGRVSALASSLGDFAKEGAKAISIANKFGALGELAPSMRRLEEATAGVVDQTTLQGYARLASDLGLTADEMEGLAQRATAMAAEQGKLAEVGSILNKLLQGSTRAYRDLGIAVDTQAESLQGLTDVEKKLAIAQEQAALGSSKQVAAISGSEVAIAQAGKKYDDLISTMQVMVAEALHSSGMLDVMGDAIMGVGRFLEANASTFIEFGSTLGNIAAVAGRMLSPALQNLMTVLDAAMLILQPFIDGLGFALGIMEDLRGVVPSLDEVASTLFVTDLPKFTDNTRDLNKQLDGWLTRTQRQIDKTKELAESAEQVKRDLELSNKNRLEENVIRLRGVAAAEQAAAALGKELEVRNGLDHATERAISVYGDEEGAIEALTAKLAIMNNGRGDAISLMNKSAVAGQDELAKTHAARLSAIQADIRQTESLISSLQGSAVARDEITTEVEKHTKTIQKEESAIRDVSAAYSAQMELLDIMMEQDEAAELRREKALETTLSFIGAVQSLGETLVAHVYEPGDAWGESGGLIGRLLGVAPEAAPSLLEEIASAFGEVADSASAAWSSIGESLNSVEDWGAKASVATKVGADLAKAFASTADASTKTDAGIAASGALIQSFVEDATTEAALMTLVEGARAATAFAIGNIPGGIAHGGAAASWALAAAFSASGGGASGGGGGGGAAGQRQTTAADVFQEPERTDTGFGGTVVFNIESLNPAASGEAVIDALNAFAENGGGGMISNTLIGSSQGRSGP